MPTLITHEATYTNDDDISAYWEYHQRRQRFYLAKDWWPKKEVRTELAKRMAKQNDRGKLNKNKFYLMGQTYNEKFKELHGMTIDEYRESEQRKTDEAFVRGDHGTVRCYVESRQRKDG